MLPFLIAAVIIFGIPTIYCAFKYKNVQKFLAGAFFVSGGMQFYFYLVNISIPLICTDAVQTPELSGLRAIIHFVLFCITFYFGYFYKSNIKKYKQ